MTGMSARALLASLRTLPSDVQKGSAQLWSEAHGWQAVAVPEGARLQVVGEGLLLFARPNLTPEQWEADCAAMLGPGRAAIDDGGRPTPSPRPAAGPTPRAPRGNF